MIEVDGAQKSGSGTILRLSLALAGIVGEPLHIFNIRKKRGRPGLRPQHLESVLTAARICNARVKGAKVGSEEIFFEPGVIEGGDVEAEIGTAGSIPMLIMTVLPLCAYAKREVKLRISKGGTDVSHSPTINYMKYVLLPVLNKMGLNAQITVRKYGYYPRGMGEVLLEVRPSKRLEPLSLESFGRLTEINGVSVCTFLADRKVAERQARAAQRYLEGRGYKSSVRVVNDFSNPVQKGSSIVLWVRSDSGVLLGGDAIGELRKLSEVVGKEAAKNLMVEVEVGVTVDVHLGDMLVPYVALAGEGSAYLTRLLSGHLESNVWLVEEILGVKMGVSKMGKCYRITR